MLQVRALFFAAVEINIEYDANWNKRFQKYQPQAASQSHNRTSSIYNNLSSKLLTHWGWVTHICVVKLTIIDSDNGLSPGRRQAIIWTNAEILLIGPLGTNFSEILIGIQTFSFKKMHLKISSAKWRPFCLGLNVLRRHPYKVKSVSPLLRSAWLVAEWPTWCRQPISPASSRRRLWLFVRKTTQDGS